MSSLMRESVVQKYQEIHEVLDEDLKLTLSHLEMEERAAVTALDFLMEKNCSLIQEIEQDLARLETVLEQSQLQPAVTHQSVGTVERVIDLLNTTDPSSVSLDEAKSQEILSLTNKLLDVIHSQTPTIEKIIKSYSSNVCLDPGTAHPQLVISPQGDSVTYVNTWQELPDIPGRFDTTLNVISLQAFSSGRHYWEVNVTGKTYWELGVTYPSISRKGTTEDCWLGRGAESWCVEYFDGEYTAWHSGLPHQLPLTRPLCHIGILCSFPAGSVTFLEADKMTPLFCFSVGTFSDCLHLALCPGHDHNGNNGNPMTICNVLSLNSDFSGVCPPKTK